MHFISSSVEKRSNRSNFPFFKQTFYRDFYTLSILNPQVLNAFKVPPCRITMNRGWIITGLVNKFTGTFHPKHVCEKLLCSICHMAIHTRISIFIQPVCCVQTIIAYTIYNNNLWFWVISFLKKMVWRLKLDFSHFIKPFVCVKLYMIWTVKLFKLLFLQTFCGRI